jgi:ABC-type glycerol-3-phosphate transport system substrate-binding protein
MHSATNDYYGGVSRVWWAQYNGAQGVTDYFEGRVQTPAGVQIGPSVAKNTGVLKAYEVLEALGKEGYYYKDGYGLEWDVAQTLFMGGAAAMLPCGDWVQTEMNKQYPNVDVQFIHYPVLTALGTEKLGITDDELALIVDYVDGKTAQKPTVSPTKNYSSDQAVEIVREARAWSNSYANNFTVCIPEYSHKAEIAKEFLKYMVSDAGQKTYARATNGLTMCYGWDLEADTEIWNSIGNFAKTRWGIVENASFLLRDRWEAYGKAGLKPFCATDEAPLPILLSRDKNPWTAQQAYDYDYETYEREWAALTARVEAD